MFSPDGKSLLANLDRDGHMAFYVMSADGSSPRALGIRTSTEKNRNPSRASWSPDGKSIVFPTVKDNGGDSMYIARVDGSGRTALPEGDHPRFSPDGRRIAFEKGRDLWVMDADGRNARAVLTSTDRVQQFQTPSWAENGQRLVFIETRQGASDIYSVKLDGSDKRRITDSAERKFYAMASPDGTRVVFTVMNMPGYVYVLHTVNIDGTGLKRLQ